MHKVFRIIFIFMIMSILTACRNTKARPPHRGEFLSLADCINAALKHQMNSEINTLNKGIMDKKNTAEMLGILYNYARYYSFPPPHSASSSIDNGARSAQLEKVRKILAFSLSYIKAYRRGDRNSLALAFEQERRIRQNLKFAVTELYYRIAATQSAIEKTEKMIVKQKEIDKFLMKFHKSNVISPLRLLDERKHLIRLEKSLMRYRRDCRDAYHKLYAMTGTAENKKVDMKCLKNIRFQPLPDISTLEKAALLERPEFINLKIAINDVRETVVQILPHHKMYNNPRIFYFPYWQEIAVCAAYASLKLPMDLEKYLRKVSWKEKESTCKLALAIGITAQVRIAHANITHTKERYGLADKTYQAYKKHLTYVKNKSPSKNKTLSKMELKRYELDTYECSINRIVSMCDYHIAYCRLLNVLGVDSLDSANLKTMMNKIKLAEEKEKAKPLSKTVIKLYLKTVNKLKKQINQQITKSR